MVRRPGTSTVFGNPRTREGRTRLSQDQAASRIQRRQRTRYSQQQNAFGARRMILANILNPADVPLPMDHDEL